MLEINKIHQGDCLNLMKDIPDKSIDLVLTDPPYGIDYQGCDRPKETNYNKIINDNNEINYKQMFNELTRLAKTIIVFGANNFCQDIPFNGRWLCWDKRLSAKADKMMGSPFELAWINRQSGYYKMYRVLHGGVVNADATKYHPLRFHPTQKPVELLSKILEDYSKEGDLVLDCFAGSCSTAIACKRMGRRFIMIEQDEIGRAHV